MFPGTNVSSIVSPVSDILSEAAWLIHSVCFAFPDYACALVGDLLLQGHLYITYNYFAFHSNVFGYVTKVP